MKWIVVLIRKLLGVSSKVKSTAGGGIDALGVPEKISKSTEDVKAGLAGEEKLRAYDSDDDEFQGKRYIKFLLFVIIPTLSICALMAWIIFKPNTDYAAAVSAAKAPTSAYGSKIPASPLIATTEAIKVGGGMFGPGSPAQAPNGGAGSAAIGPAIKCYAMDDVRGVFSDTLALRETLIIPTMFTRANGGMVFSPKFGWLRWGQVRCVGDLMQIEIEYVPPPKTKTVVPTSKPVKAAPTASRPTETPLPTASATLTRVPGIHTFYSYGCSVTWLVTGVQQVFLIYSGNRVGVSGDNAGSAVTYDLCPFVGTVKIEAVRYGISTVQTLEIR